MPEYVWIIGLIIGTMSVVCQIIVAVTACKSMNMTCRAVEKQIKDIEKSETPLFYGFKPTTT